MSDTFRYLEQRLPSPKRGKACDVVSGGALSVLVSMPVSEPQGEQSTADRGSLEIVPRLGNLHRWQDIRAEFLAALFAASKRVLVICVSASQLESQFPICFIDKADVCADVRVIMSGLDEKELNRLAVHDIKRQKVAIHLLADASRRFATLNFKIFNFALFTSFYIFDDLSFTFDYFVEGVSSSEALIDFAGGLVTDALAEKFEQLWDRADVFEGEIYPRETPYSVLSPKKTMSDSTRLRALGFDLEWILTHSQSRTDQSFEHWITDIIDSLIADGSDDFLQAFNSDTRQEIERIWLEVFDSTLSSFFSEWLREQLYPLSQQFENVVLNIPTSTRWTPFPTSKYPAISAVSLPKDMGFHDRCVATETAVSALPLPDDCTPYFHATSWASVEEIANNSFQLVGREALDFSHKTGLYFHSNLSAAIEHCEKRYSNRRAAIIVVAVDTAIQRDPSYLDLRSPSQKQLWKQVVYAFRHATPGKFDAYNIIEGPGFKYVEPFTNPRDAKPHEWNQLCFRSDVNFFKKYARPLGVIFYAPRNESAVAAANPACVDASLPVSSSSSSASSSAHVSNDPYGHSSMVVERAPVREDEFL